MPQPLTVFSQDKLHGLRRGSTELLPACYDAVWEITYGFWCFRRGEVFGVLAADGQLVSPCELPAAFNGFAQLSIDEELEIFLELEEDYLPFMRRRFPQLHTYEGMLCQPATWRAEEITPYLTDADGEVWLPTPTRRLVLRPDGSWHWTAEAPHKAALYFAAQAPANIFVEAREIDFSPAADPDLIYWRLVMLEAPLSGEEQPDATTLFMEALEDAQGQASHYQSIQALLADSRIRPMGPVEGVDMPFYKPFDLAALLPEVRQACEAHIDTIFEVNADSMVLVEQLIYLAWLWANDFVFYDPADGMHWVDSRYEFDNGWFDNHIIDNIYQHHELVKLRPLLRETSE